MARQLGQPVACMAQHRQSCWGCCEAARQFQQAQQGPLQTSGYIITYQHLELQAGMLVPVWQLIGDAGKAPKVLSERRY